MAIINRNINYTNRGFTDLRDRLINYTKTYFPNTYTDFDPSSPGIMFMEQAAYVGDVLSFYLDNQIQETYTQFARQNNNLYELAYMFGYKPKLTGLSTVNIDFYQQIPAKTENGAQIPDYNYSLLIPENTTVANAGGTNFIIEDPVDFSVSNSLDPTTISIAQISGDEPTYFLLKKSRKALSGTIKSLNFSLGQYQEFPTLNITDSAFGGIIDVFDSEGNQYHEVDYLAQELVFKSTKNTNVNDPNNYQNEGDTPYLLQTFQTPYRFVTRVLNSSNIELQFGSGNPNDTTEDIIPNPKNVGLGLPFEKNKLTTAYSPNNFIFTDTYGIAPSNTTITVRYLSGGGVSSNVASSTLTNLSTADIKFQTQNLNSTTANYVFNSLASSNPNAASGGRGGDTTTELRQNILANSNTQLRTVTSDDYLVRTLSMPGKYGIVSKAFAQKPKVNQSNSNLDIYVLSYNSSDKLAYASNTLKDNIKTYLSKYRTIGDNISIKDAFIVNIGCEFDIITDPNVNNAEVLRSCISSVKGLFLTDRWQINQPIILRQIEQIVDNTVGVQTVKNVKIINKSGISNGYSQYAYDIDGATQNKVIYPSLDPMIFEVKYPNEDIKARVVNL